MQQNNSFQDLNINKKTWLSHTLSWNDKRLCSGHIMKLWLKWCCFKTYGSLTSFWSPPLWSTVLFTTLDTESPSSICIDSWREPSMVTSFVSMPSADTYLWITFRVIWWMKQGGDNFAVKAVQCKHSSSLRMNITDLKVWMLIRSWWTCLESYFLHHHVAVLICVLLLRDAVCWDLR